MTKIIFKYLSCIAVVLLLCAVAETVRAQDELKLNLEEDAPKKDYTAEAEAFFNDCVKKPIMPTNEETDMAFCACASSHYLAWLTDPKQLDSNKEFFETINKVELDKNTLLTDVYGPCMYVPIYDDTYEQCFYDNTKPYFSKTPARRRNYCNCEAQGESEYFKKFLVPFIEKRILEGKEIVDPIRELRRDIHYYDEHRKVHASCYAEETNRKHYKSK